MSGIFDEMISLDNLLAAWREFRRGKSDRADVADFSRHLEDNLFALHEELTVGTYRPGAYHRFRISDPKPRVIHKAEVRDRVVHHAFCRVAAPIFERSFIHDSYSCRIGKGTHAAVRRLEDFARQASDNYRYGCWALKFDIRKFFDSVDHALLLGIVGQKLGYGKATALARRIVGSFAKKSSGGGLSWERRAKGLPIGNLTSQLFANVYLDEFDHYVKDILGIKHYIRYTDDAVVLDRDRNHLVELLSNIADWLRQHRRLELHPKKVEIRKLLQGIDFLGCVVLPYHAVLRTGTKRRMLKRVNAGNIASYLGLLEHCDSHRLKTKILRNSEGG